MQLHIPAAIQQRLSLPAMVDTAQLNQQQIQNLYERLSDLPNWIEEMARSTEERSEILAEISALTVALIDEIGLADDPVAPQQGVPPVVQQAVAVPHAGKIKNLRGNFGSDVHDQMHFAPTVNKAHHGVWRTKDLKKVRAWVRLAVDSIHAADKYVVNSKNGNQPGACNYLVFMDTEVGYLSGSAVTGKPATKYLEVYVDAKGNTVSAFPSDPTIFV